MSGAPPGLLHNATGAQSPSGNNNNNSSLITIVKAQISFLLSTLTDENFTKNKQDIAQVRFLTFSARILMPRIANSCSSSPCSVLPPAPNGSANLGDPDLRISISPSNDANNHILLHSIQLIEQHGTEAQNHFLRRLILSCAASSSSSSAAASSNSANSSSSNGNNTNTGATSSSTNSSSNPSSVLSPTSTAPAPAQVPLYLRLLSQETKRLVKDPLQVDKFVSAILSGLNDPSASTSDTFKSLDIPSLIERLSLSAFEKGLLNLELVRLSLPDDTYGMRSNGAAVTSKRRAIGKWAAQALQYESFDPFIVELESAQLTDAQASKLVALAVENISIKEDGSAYYGSGNDGSPIFSSIEEPKRLCTAIDNIFGHENAINIFTNAVSYLHYPSSSSDSLKTYARELLSVLIPTPEANSAQLIQAVIEHSGALASESSRSLEQQVADLLEELISQVGTTTNVAGPAFIHAVDSIAQSRGASPPRWDQIIQLLITGGDIESTSYQPTFGFEDTALFSSLFTVKAGGDGYSNLDGLFAKYKEGEYQLTALRVLITTPTLNSSFNTLPSDEKIIDSQDISSNLIETSIPMHIKTAITSQAAQSETSFWNTKRLVPALLQSDNGAATQESSLSPLAKYLFEVGLQQAPELVILSLVGMEQVCFRFTFTLVACAHILNYLVHTFPIEL